MTGKFVDSDSSSASQPLIHLLILQHIRKALVSFAVSDYRCIYERNLGVRQYLSIS